VVTWSAAVPVATKGCEMLAAEGVKVDLSTCARSGPGTRRRDRVGEEDRTAAGGARGRRVAGFGAEIVARVVDQVGPSNLKAAKRLAAPRIPIPVRAALGGRSARDAREGRKGREGADRLAAPAPAGSGARLANSRSGCSGCGGACRARSL
jgi:hypothetical protein